MNLSNQGVIKELLHKYDLTLSKGLGQNFLINPSVCPKIAELGNAKSGFGVLEIGTGIGVLTRELAARANKVVAIEIDKRLLPVLEETLEEFSNVKIINEDVLRVDLKRLFAEEFAGLQITVCANLPYYITSPILMLLLEQRLPITSITVMVQKEAAERLCAPLGTRECGAVTVAVRYYSEPKVLFPVSKGSFMPAPNVDSCVIRLDVREHTPENVADEAFFFKVVKSAFSQRRKTVLNSISAGLSLPKDIVSAALTKASVKLTARAEQLQMEEFIAIANALKTS